MISPSGAAPKSSLSTPAKGAEGTQAPEEGIGRREALARMLRGAELAALVSPVALLAYGGHLEEGRERKAIAVSKATGRYPRTTETCTFADGGSFENLGVVHSAAFLSQCRSHIEAKIQAADIVLLEGSGELIKLDPFFGEVARLALYAGKKVYCIDNQRFIPSSVQFLGSPAASAAGAIGLLITNRASAEQHESPRRKFLATFSRVLGWTGYLSSPHSISSSAATLLGRYPLYDVSYSTDGRTVSMLTEIRSKVKDNPASSVLCISGDVHARAFGFYARHPTFAAFKQRIYQLVYNSWLRGPTQELRLSPHESVRP